MNFGMCGRWRNGRLVNHCTMAGTEECDFECPYRDAPDDVEEQADAEPAASGVGACGSHECKAAQRDGVLCADGECDRVNGVRPDGVPASRGEVFGKKDADGGSR